MNRIFVNSDPPPLFRLLDRAAVELVQQLVPEADANDGDSPGGVHNKPAEAFQPGIRVIDAAGASGYQVGLAALDTVRQSALVDLENPEINIPRRLRQLRNDPVREGAVFRHQEWQVSADFENSELDHIDRVSPSYRRSHI